MHRKHLLRQTGLFKNAADHTPINVILDRNINLRCQLILAGNANSFLVLFVPDIELRERKQWVDGKVQSRSIRFFLNLTKERRHRDVSGVNRFDTTKKNRTDQNQQHNKPNKCWGHLNFFFTHSFPSLSS